MILADKAKGLFISNISHELRTPLHGILAAAELLNESPLNHSQASFLQTVQACGTSLVETVNHVLDFTKLSGNSKSGGVENVIVPTQVDLMQLVEDAVDGCWIGHRARTAMGDSGIGSVYAPPSEDPGSAFTTHRKHVETVVDIGYCPEGWSLKCEKGGIRRVLMNLFGNSLKFTSDGYVHVLLRQLPRGEDDPLDKVKVELAVFDTGKGISQNFLKNQLFHPFSQENPLQTGTGLGLAIVNSIVTSENIDGTVDVWSEEGVGTEIKVVFSAEIVSNGTQKQNKQSFRADTSNNPTVSLVGFDTTRKGVKLLYDTTRNYLTTWWGFDVVDDGDIVILNDDRAPVIAATERRDTNHPFIFLSAARGDPTIMSIASEYERIGGFCRILYKPGGPSRLRVILKLCVHALGIGRTCSSSPMTLPNGDADYRSTDGKEQSVSGSSIPRRKSENTYTRSRPGMAPRSSTAHPLPVLRRPLSAAVESVETVDPDTRVPTITSGPGGTILKSSVSTLDSEHRFRVLVVEDNGILRNLLTKWLSKKGYDFRSAVDGRDGVDVYEKDGPFDVVLLDLSMPVLDGVGATLEIRRLESDRQTLPRTRILALTGMSSLEDKRRAFEAGVDGYLVKPVAFKTLDDMFHKLGV
jgi:signal transduction histidine kinase/CheY-like chemotaxis protein